MSGGDWDDLPGPGVRGHDPALDGHTPLSRKREPGSMKGPGSRGPRSKTRNQLLYGKWLEHVSPATFGKLTTSRVDAPVFAAGVRAIREDELAHLDDKDRDRVIAKAFQMYAADVRTGRLKVRGKPAWFMFLGRRGQYLDRALAQTREDTRMSRDIEIRDDDGWI